MQLRILPQRIDSLLRNSRHLGLLDSFLGRLRMLRPLPHNSLHPRNSQRRRSLNYGWTDKSTPPDNSCLVDRSPYMQMCLPGTGNSVARVHRARELSEAVGR